MRWRRAAGRQVVDTSTAGGVGRLDGLVIDPATARVSGLVVGERVVDWDDIAGFGPDAVTIASADVLHEPRRDLEHAAVEGRAAPFGKRLLTEDGVARGTVGDLELDPDTGVVTCLVLADDEIAGSRLLGIGSHAVVVSSSERAADDLASLTKDELYEMAKEQDLSGRSSMTKAELVDALR